MPQSEERDFAHEVEDAFHNIELMIEVSPNNVALQTALGNLRMIGKGLPGLVRSSVNSGDVNARSNMRSLASDFITDADAMMNSKVAKMVFRADYDSDDDAARSGRAICRITQIHSILLNKDEMDSPRYRQIFFLLKEAILSIDSMETLSGTDALLMEITNTRDRAYRYNRLPKTADVEATLTAIKEHIPLEWAKAMVSGQAKSS